MRLTPEFVSKRSSHLNALKERELELRGLQIPVIENLASHQGTYDTLNLTDNSITVLGNIPLAPRLRQLHASQNQISSISPSLPPNIPNIVTLVLSHNLISALSTLSPLEHLPHLRHLSLIGNPVTESPHYRPYIIYKLAKGLLHTLDFTRIKDSERSSAKALFTDEITGGPNALALQISTQTASTIPGVGNGTASAKSAFAAAAKSGQVIKGGKGRLMTPEEKRRVVMALQKAQTAEEVRRLERMLAEGLIPEGESGVDGVEGGGNGEGANGSESHGTTEVNGS